jgi:hypothetical protein
MRRKADTSHRPSSELVRVEPISVRIPLAIAMTGFSRSRLYELIATGEIEIAKDRRTTLVLVDSLRAAVERRRSTENRVE